MAKKKVSKRTRPTKNIKKTKRTVRNTRTTTVRVPRRRRGVTVKIDTETVTVNVGPEKPRDTVISFLLDESGSMQDCLMPTISGFNEYLNGLLKNRAGDTRFTFTKFDSTGVKIVHNSVRLENVAKLSTETYRPGASTPLFDAIGKTIRELETTLASRMDKPAVLFVIMTDGLENASREFTQDSIKKLIKQKESEGWDFTYLGAKHDAYAASSNIGLAAGNTVKYDTNNTVNVFATLGDVHTSYLSAHSTGHGSTLCRSALFSPEAKKSLEETVETKTK